MTQLAAEAHRVLDALTRALMVSQKPRRKCEVRRGGHTRVLSKPFYYLAVARSNVTAESQFELASRLRQVTAVGASQSEQSVGNRGLGNAAFRFRFLKKTLGDIPKSGPPHGISAKQTGRIMPETARRKIRLAL
jgi:hypothetical protein